MNEMMFIMCISSYTWCLNKSESRSEKARDQKVSDQQTYTITKCLMGNMWGLTL